MSATTLDGALIGAAVGAGIQVLPALTGLIATNHPDEAKTVIIGVWLTSIVIGAIVGSVLASVWGAIRQHFAREGRIGVRGFAKRGQDRRLNSVPAASRPHITGRSNTAPRPTVCC